MAERICRACNNWESRPEEGMGYNAGYCRVHDRITRATYTCEHFEVRKLVSRKLVSIEEEYERAAEEDDLD